MFDEPASQEITLKPDETGTPHTGKSRIVLSMEVPWDDGWKGPPRRHIENVDNVSEIGFYIKKYQKLALVSPLSGQKPCLDQV